MIKQWRAKQTKEGEPLKVPVGTFVKVIQNYPRRRVLVEYKGELILTQQACLRQVSLDIDDLIRQAKEAIARMKRGNNGF